MNGLTPELLAIDWLARNLFWVNHQSSCLIEVTSLINKNEEGEFLRKTLIKDDLNKPRALALDLERGCVLDF